jgi:hemerythrin
MANSVMHAIEIADCSVMSQAFELFDNRLREHFESEENIARVVKFPFSRHKLAQRYFLKELDLLREELLARGGAWCEDSIRHYSDSVKGLLLEHIISKDMEMKPSLQIYPYNFGQAGL